VRLPIATALILGSLQIFCRAQLSERFIYPVGVPSEKPTPVYGNANGYVVMTRFADAHGHTGVDLANGSEGGEIHAIGPGVVSLKKNESESVGFGNVVIIRHDLPDGTYYSLYAHMQEGSVVVKEGDSVDAGTLIGRVDCSGATSGDTACQNGHYGPHLHFAVKKLNTLGCGYVRQGCTSGDVIENYVDPLDFVQKHSGSAQQIVLHADPKDIWTTSVYSYANCSGTFPGGGLNDNKLRVGGWGDLYYSLLNFDLTGQPGNVHSAVLYLYCFNQLGGGTPMYLDRITDFWDWQTQGHGCDRLRLWWGDRPNATQLFSDAIPNPTAGQWYSVDLTDLYNKWQNGTYQNYGIQLRPQYNFNNNFNEFYSEDYADNPDLRPKLVITP
jgi:hypothetical protein